MFASPSIRSRPLTLEPLAAGSEIRGRRRHKPTPLVSTTSTTGLPWLGKGHRDRQYQPVRRRCGMTAGRRSSAAFVGNRAAGVVPFSASSEQFRHRAALARGLALGFGDDGVANIEGRLQYV